MCHPTATAVRDQVASRDPLLDATAQAVEIARSAGRNAKALANAARAHRDGDPTGRERVHRAALRLANNAAGLRVFSDLARERL